MVHLSKSTQTLIELACQHSSLNLINVSSHWTLLRRKTFSGLQQELASAKVVFKSGRADTNATWTTLKWNVWWGWRFGSGKLFQHTEGNSSVLSRQEKTREVVKNRIPFTVIGTYSDFDGNTSWKCCGCGQGAWRCSRQKGLTHCLSEAALFRLYSACSVITALSRHVGGVWMDRYSASRGSDKVGMAWERRLCKGVPACRDRVLTFLRMTPSVAGDLNL